MRNKNNTYIGVGVEGVLTAGSRQHSLVRFGIDLSGELFAFVVADERLPRTEGMARGGDFASQIVELLPRHPLLVPAALFEVLDPRVICQQGFVVQGLEPGCNYVVATAIGVDEDVREFPARHDGLDYIQGLLPFPKVRFSGGHWLLLYGIGTPVGQLMKLISL